MQHELNAKIRESYNSLPKNHRKIADYMIENSERVAFLNVQDISKATGASVASVVRFAQRIGFSGFSEIREEAANNLQNHLQHNHRFPLIETEDLADVFTTVANQDIKNINETLHLINNQDFKKAVRLIKDADRVYTSGLGISFLLSRMLSYQLMQVGIDACPYKHDYTTFLEQALLLKNNDLVIVFSFPPYSKETIDLAKFAYERGNKVIAISNKPAAPATFHAEMSLIVKSENLIYTNSIAAITVLINAITTECALQDKQKAKHMLKDLEKIAHNQNLVIE